MFSFFIVLICVHGESKMNKLGILLIGISSLLLVTGCKHAKEETNNEEQIVEITEAEFSCKFNDMGTITYSKATVHATEVINGTGDFATNRNEERTEVYTHYTDPDAWIVNNGDSLLRRYVYNFDCLTSFKSWVQNPELTYEYIYYSDLSVNVEESGTYTEDYMGVTRTVSIESTMSIKLNEYGYLISLEGGYFQDITAVAGETTGVGTRSGVSTISITYK